MLALAIERRLARGTTDGELEELIDRFKRDNTVVFTVGTLEYLQKGGRIGKAQALAGSLLNVKPILSCEDGVVVPVGKVRGRQKALAEFRRLFEEATEDRPGLRVSIAHADAPEWIDEITTLALEARPQAEIELVENLGAVVGTHAGPGAVGFFWFQDDDRLVVAVAVSCPDPSSSLPVVASARSGVGRRLRRSVCVVRRSIVSPEKTARGLSFPTGS